MLGQHQSGNLRNMKGFGNQTRYLDLRFVERIANGQQRNIYLLHGRDCGPDFPDVPFVLKVPRHLERQKRLSRSKRLVRRLYPTSSRRILTKEAHYFAKLSQKYDGNLHQIPIPAFMGFIETSHGTGALWQAICDEQGQLAPTLQNLVDENKVFSALEPLNSFVQTVLEANIALADVNYRNLVYGQKSEKKRFFVVDGFGDHRVISLRELSRQYNRGCLISGFEKIARQAGLSFDRRTNRFYPGIN